MHLEEFAEGTSILHRLDPRIKFLALMPYIAVIAILQDLKGPLAGLAVSITLIAFARISIRKLLSRLFVVNIFVFSLWIFIPFSFPGKTVIEIFSLSASREGFLYVLSITMKTNAIVLATIATLGTSEVFSLAHAFVHLKAPEKLVYLFFFFYRYISILHEEYSRLKKAMKIRSFRPHTNLHTYKSFAYLVGMLIVSSFERSQRIYSAMLCRGFHGKFPVITHFRMRKADVVFWFAMTAVTIAIIITGEI